MKKLILLIGLIGVSCSAPTKVYTIDMTLRNGREITRQYDLPDSISFHIKERKKKRKTDTFLVYKENELTCPRLLRKNVIKYKIK